MRRSTKSLVSFTRIERMGIICLCAILLILLSIRTTMSSWVHPAADTARQRQLIIAWDSFKNHYAKPDTIHTKTPDSVYTGRLHNTYTDTRPSGDTSSLKNITFDMLKKNSRSDSTE